MTTQDRKKQIERIIKKVQESYPENSKEALSFAIKLTIIEENDYWINTLKGSDKTNHGS